MALDGAWVLVSAASSEKRRGEGEGVDSKRELCWARTLCLLALFTIDGELIVSP